MDRNLQKEIDAVVKKLELFRKSIGDDTIEKILAEAAEPAKVAMQNAAPSSKTSHLVRDGDGKSKRVQPGNLKNSIQIFKARKGKRKVALVGPVVSKKSKITKLVGGPKVSRAKRAFYWKFVNYGTARQAPNRFIEKARSQSSGAVLAKLKGGINKYLDKKIQKIFD
jgi:HK97 gp10 family phage protein